MASCLSFLRVPDIARTIGWYQEIGFTCMGTHQEPGCDLDWALMDYGSWLKANGVRNISSSKHYKKQSALKGSIREVRGQIIRELTVENMNLKTLQERIRADNRFDLALSGLIADGLVERVADQLHLTK